MIKHWQFVAAGLALILLAYYYFAVYYQGSKRDYRQNQIRQQAVQKQWETKTDEQGAVLIKATPAELDKDLKQWRFTVAFSTHSGDLDIDPAKAVSLADDKGSVYETVFWEGPGPGGHHIEGALIFNAVGSDTKFVELKIKNVGGIPERSLKWDLK